MRAAIAGAALLLALAACSVEVEGARCDQPGSAEQCPSGQACGNDGRCSERVGGCISSSAFCVAGVDRRCNGTRREQCAEGDACGAWQLVEECGALHCDRAADVCRCPDVLAELAVDPAAPALPDGKVANGAPEPAGCRLRSLTAGLAAAKAKVDADANANVIVRAVGAAGATRSFSAAASSEVFPLDVPGRVTLTSDAATTASTYEILFDDSTTAAAAVMLGAGSSLARFTVRASPGDPRPLGIRVACGTAEKVTLEKIVVDTADGAALVTGIELRGTCEVDLSDVRISGATTTCLDVGMGSATTVARMDRGRVERCRTGIVLTHGDLRLAGTVVADNSGSGVEAGDGLFDTQLTASDALFTGNADTALLLNGNSSIDLQDNRFCSNGATSERGSAARKVGGIFARGAPPSGGLVFKRNEIRDNVADQVLISSTNGTWNLDGGADAGACASDRNLFLEYSGAGRGLVTTGASATARWNGWSGITPTPGQDYEAIAPGTIDAGVTGAQFCDPVPQPRPCP